MTSEFLSPHRGTDAGIVSPHRRNHPFFAVPTVGASTSAGPVRQPVNYYDGSAVLSFFLVSGRAAERRLSGTGLRPATQFDGRALLGVASYEYRNTGVGAYREVAAALVVHDPLRPRNWLPWLELLRRPDRARIGAYVMHMPVTTELAYASGRELLGLPKFVTAIEFEWTGGAFTTNVHAPGSGDVVLTLSGRLGPALPIPHVDQVLYSHLDGTPVRTALDVHGPLWLHPASRLRLSVRPDHPLGEDLRELGVEHRTPVAVIATRRYRARLAAGAPLAGETAHDDSPTDPRR